MRASSPDPATASKSADGWMFSFVEIVYLRRARAFLFPPLSIKGISGHSRAPHFGAEHPSGFGIARLDRIRIPATSAPRPPPTSAPRAPDMAQHGSGELRTTFGSAADIIVEQAFLERTRVHPGVWHTKTRRVCPPCSAAHDASRAHHDPRVSTVDGLRHALLRTSSLTVVCHALAPRRAN